jgi:hypothetical protein
MPKLDHGEDLFRLIYASRAVLPELPRFEALVDDILKVSRPNNERAGLTGLLLAHQGWFVQALEGPRRRVSRTFGDIGRDLRHVQLEMLSAGPAENRLFGAWSMCARTLTPAARPALKALDLEGDFDPFSLTAEKSLQLLQLMARIEPGQPLRRAG